MAKKKHKAKQPDGQASLTISKVEPNTIRWGHDVLIAVHGDGFQVGMGCALNPEFAAEIPEFEKANVLATTVTSESAAVIRVKASPGETVVNFHLVAVNPASSPSIPGVAVLP